MTVTYTDSDAAILREAVASNDASLKDYSVGLAVSKRRQARAREGGTIEYAALIAPTALTGRAGDRGRLPAMPRAPVSGRATPRVKTDEDRRRELAELLASDPQLRDDIAAIDDAAYWRAAAQAAAAMPGNFLRWVRH
ncbi:MAG: hypothetical protein M1140_07495 [Chloroflexi bacterium]|nr:hypothetical protein [Chloroflexota bacterium]